MSVRATRIARVLVERHGPRIESYVEPFLGGGNVAEAVAPHCVSMKLGDLRADMVLMFEALVDEAWSPPETVSESRYRAVVSEPPSPERAFYGTSLSFGGKWFSGYVPGIRPPGSKFDDRRGGVRACERARSLLRQADSIEWFPGVDYRRVPVKASDVVYCDPPYADTIGYGKYVDGTRWDARAFWAWAQSCSARGAHVYVSEARAPAGWRSVWSASKRVTMADAESRRARIEHLYTLGPDVSKLVAAH